METLFHIARREEWEGGRDAGAHYEHAAQRGATILGPPSDFPYGERQYEAEDLAGHHWDFTQSIADLAPEDWGGTSGPALGDPG